LRFDSNSSPYAAICGEGGGVYSVRSWAAAGQATRYSPDLLRCCLLCCVAHASSRRRLLKRNRRFPRNKLLTESLPEDLPGFGMA